jgi:Tol biopolymer transport system component
MALTAGSRLGPYEVDGPLGAGGMGEVYRARDTRLDRTVALKVLPSHLSSDPTLRQRFEREARAISQLSHPNICVLHDIGRDQGVDYLVMEHLEGETLAARLQRGALALREALAVATQIADALDRAHRQGVVHRDLKPGNIMLTRSGAKLLDFGLARTLVTDGFASGASPVATAMPTVPPATPLTAAGAVVGTFQYMAPEQLEGREADARSDIFSFGLLVYEMVSGQRAFPGKTGAGLVAAILRDEPRPLAETAPAAPAGLERIVRACLAKDPADRWQTMHDVLLQLRFLAEGGALSSPAAAIPAPRARGVTRERLAWGVAAVSLAAAAITGFLGLQQPDAGVQPVLRASVAPPPGVGVFLQGTEPGPVALSPDGRALAFSGRDVRGKVQLYVRSLSSPEATPLAGTEGASYPFWSPDSRSIGYFGPGAVFRIGAGGGPATRLCDAGNGKGGSWSTDGTILFALAFNTPLHKVSASGGVSEAVTTLDTARRENSHRFPRFLPDGKHFLFLARVAGSAPGESNAVRLGTLGSMESVVLTNATSQALYAGGRLLFMQGTNLLAQPFDLAGLRLTGEPRRLLDQVRFLSGAAAGLFDASDDGVLVYHPVRAESDSSEVWWSDPRGEQLTRVGEVADYFDIMRISPDGRSAAMVITDRTAGTPDIWLLDLARGSRTRLTLDPGAETLPIWSPDGRRIVYTSDRAGERFGLVVTTVGSSAEPEHLLVTGEAKFPSAWSPDGQEVAFNEIAVATGSDVWILRVGEKTARPLLSSRFNEVDASWSPDGRRLAYVSDESGRNEVHVIDYPGGGDKRQISTEGGFNPRWHPGGRAISWQTGAGEVMTADVTGSGSGISFGAPRLLFLRPDLVTFEVSPDGERYLLMTNPELVENDSISLVVNWPRLASD